MDYRCEFYDTVGTLLGIINKEATVDFEWAKCSGCGRFSITLARRFDDWNDIVAFNNRVKIYVNNVLWYQGLIQDFTPSLTTAERVSIVGMGYIEQLNWSDESWAYQDMDISDLIKGLIAQHIFRDQLDIVYDKTQFQKTDITIDSIQFLNQKAKDCIDCLNTLAGTWDYGVDENRVFYFRDTNQDGSYWDVDFWDVGYWQRNLPKVWVLPQRYVETYEPLYSSSQLVNRIILTGGKLPSGDNLYYIYDDTASVLQYKARPVRESQQSIVSNQMALLYCQARMLRLSVPQKRVNITLRGFENLIRPGEVLEMRGSRGELIDQHEATIIGYTVDDNGIQTRIEADRPQPNLMKDIRLMKMDIAALQAQGQIVPSYYTFYETIYRSPTDLVLTGPLWDVANWDVDNFEGEVSDMNLVLSGGGGSRNVQL